MCFNAIDSGSKSDIRSIVFYGETLVMFHQLFADSLMRVLLQHADAVQLLSRFSI